MEPTELRQALEEWHSASFGWALLCCRDRELAEEVLQSVYLRLLREHATYDGRASFRTWLFAVIRNAASDRRRQTWWSQVIRLTADAWTRVADPQPDGSLQLEQHDKVAQVRQALARLPERQQQVAHLVFYENLTIAQAAVVLGIHVGTARQHYTRAKQALYRQLQLSETGDDDEGTESHEPA